MLVKCRGQPDLFNNMATEPQALSLKQVGNRSE
jgi:hypothetical protein